MTGSNASSGEMPRVPLPGRAGRDQDEQLLDMILDRRPLPPDAPSGMHALADELVGLAAPPGTGDLPGQAAAMAAFVRAGSPASTLLLAGAPTAHQPRVRRAAVRVRLAAAIAVVVAGLSGTAAAAYAGVLPASVQNFAHRVIDAPAAPHAVHHGNDAQLPRAGHSGSAPSASHAGHPAHPAKPGKGKSHTGRGHRGHHGKPSEKANPAHSAKPAHPAPKAHPTHTPGPQNQ